LSFSALQRAEIAEIWSAEPQHVTVTSFSALQRAEIAEIGCRRISDAAAHRGFSALQRAEIAEIPSGEGGVPSRLQFQCSSTSRNC